METQSPATASGVIVDPSDPAPLASGVMLPNTGVGPGDQTQSGFSYQVLAIAVVLIAVVAIGVVNRRGDRSTSR